ncbi:MAG: YraN family protein [Bacteroidales bacterium]|nr:YraN family protein [Bacteroidales bacterium]
MTDKKKLNPLWEKGESAAVDYLSAHGYSILHRNWRYIHLEIDIIAQKDNFIIIAEVKTRKSEFCADPTITVTKGKQRLLIKAAQAFLTLNNIQIETRFDVITVIFSNDDTPLIEHIKDAFYPTL